MLARRFLIIVSILLAFIIVMPVTAAPIPTVTLDVPATVGIGEAFTFTATFTNTHPTDVGYGPIIDLIFPFNGADGAAGTDTPDGVDFISAEYINAPVNAIVRVFPNDGGGAGCVNHPFLQDTDSRAIEVCGTAGDKLVVLELPFGSYVPTQPPAEITINAQMSNLADLGVALNIQARGAFRFGQTPLDDPCCDPSLIGTMVSAPVTPVLISGEKTNNAPEGEAATGPNFNYTWTITLDIAAGQTVNNLTVTDFLPNSVVIDPATIATVPATGVVLSVPPPGAPANPPDNRIVIEFPAVTGGAGAEDVIVTFDFYVAYLDANGNPTVNPATGERAPVLNNFSAVGDWTPNDPRDAASQGNANVNGGCPTVCPGGNAPDAMAIAGQKTGLTVPAGGVIRPGALLEYTIAFQVSDFFAFGNVVITDVLSDGLRFDNTFIPQLSFTGAMTNFTQAAGANGTTILTFRITDELGGPLLGGCVPPGGTGGGAPDCTFNNGATSGTLTYRAVVLDDFLVDFPSGDPSVDHGDTLTNRMTITGDLLDTGNTANPLGTGQTDDSELTLTVERGLPVKSIYAVNGVPCGACLDLRLAAGDTITYRLRHEMPSSNFEDFALVDFLPLPVFSAAEVTVFSLVLDDAVPPAGTAKLLVPGDTLHTLMGTLPTLLTDVAANTVTFFYGNYDTPTNQQSFIDILFTVTMRSDPIADGLQLTNQIQARESSTNSGASQENDIVQVEVTSPLLKVTKGVIATTNPEGQFLPANPGPVPFNPPGSPSPFDGIINSDLLAAQPIDSDLTGVQPGDLITFAVVIENVGTSRNGAFDIRVRDLLPPGFIIPEGVGLNLQIQLGSGQSISYFGLDGGGDLDFFGTGLELIDTGLDTGVCGPYNGVDGTNIIIITYQLQLTVPPQNVLTNITTVTSYSSQEGGANHAGSQGITDRAQVGVGDTDLTTTDTGTGTGTSIGLTKGVEPPFAQPGDAVTWTITISNNGAAPVTNIRVVDTITNEVEVQSVVASGGGAVTQTGNTYTAAFDLLNPGQQETLIIRAVIRRDVTSVMLTNTARAFQGEIEVSAAGSSVVIAGTMPQTGETPDSPLRRRFIGLAGRLAGAW